MPRLDDFREMVDGITDLKVLEAGQVLLREMLQINEMKRKIEEFESSQAEGGKAIFLFFAEELDEDELVFATERISGRIKRMEREEALKNPKKDEDVEEQSEE